MGTRHHRDEGGWQDEVGYARAVRRGSRIEVSGTTALGGGGVADADDTERQTRDALGRALAAVAELGGRDEDVIRTRMLLAPGADWRAAGRVHGELLGHVAPANTTLFVAALLGEGALIEVEVEAEVLDVAT